MQVEVDTTAVVGAREASGAIGLQPDLAYLRTGLANVVFVGRPGDWVLIDAGFPGYRNTIRRAAEARFGAGARPRAILLTHGHVDHVGALPRLAEDWDVPVFAHVDEHPFLNGGRSYPPARPRLSDGLLSLSSVLFRRSPKDLGARLQALPKDGSAPFMPGWRWIGTPGHTPGHVAFWHEERRVVIAGDAFVTTAQEELSSVLAQRPELHGPPRYFTPDGGRPRPPWPASPRSGRSWP